MVLVVSLLLSAAPAKASDVTTQLGSLLGVPYVDDEVLDETGRWTFFEHPETTAPSPGLNCSGFVVTATRRLFSSPLTLSETTRDRLDDSGDDSPLGRDWDFGWDLVMNLSEGRPRRVLGPDGEQDVASQDARTDRGFPVDDAKAWKKVLPRLRADAVYLVSLSRVRARRLEHHHVALMFKEGGHVWFYQTLPKGRAHRLDLTTEKGFTRMQGMFGAAVRVLLVEVELQAAPGDGGTFTADAGSIARDAGSTSRDTGSPSRDAGGSRDAGSPSREAGSPSRDASSSRDAGSTSRGVGSSLRTN